MSVVEGTEIRDNTALSIETFNNELTSCNTLCYVPSKFLDLYQTQITTIHENEYQFSAILGNFKLGAGTTVSGASAIIQSYSGNIQIEGVTVSDSTLSEIFLDLTATTLEVEDTSFNNVNSL